MTTHQERRDEVDVLRMFATLASWWLEVLFAGLLLAVLAVVVYVVLQMFSTSRYSASADVAIMRTVSDVSFDERFTTQTEMVAGNTLVSRRNALLSLASSPAVAQQVIGRLGEMLPLDLQDPSALAETVSVELATSAGVRGDSDLIRITVTSESPDISAAVATEWARVYVENVNKVYVQVPDELIASIEQERAAAESDYTDAQTAVETALTRNPVDELKRQIEDAEALLTSLRKARQDLLDGIIGYAVRSRNQVASTFFDEQTTNLTTPYSHEQAMRRSIVTSYLTALYAGQRLVVSEQERRTSEFLRSLDDDWLQVVQALRSASALREQVEAYPDETLPGSGVLVLALLKLQTLTQALSVTPLPASGQGASSLTNIVDSPLQIQLDDKSSVTRESLLADIDALIAALTTYSTVLEAKINETNEQLRVGAGYKSLEFTTPDDSALVTALTKESTPWLSQSLLSLSTMMTSTTASIVEDMSKYDIGELAAFVTNDPAMTAAIADVEARLRRLRSAVESESDVLSRLIRRRDLALDAYTSVNNKIAEQTLARAAAGSEVRFAAPAVAPSEPLSSGSPVLFVAIGSILGVTLGIGYALLAALNGQKSYLMRRRLRTVTATS